MLDDFLGLGLIGLVYGVCLLLEAWGFLAIFFAAISLRQSELKLAGIHAPSQDADAAPDAPAHTEESLPQHSPQMSEGSLLFKEPLERLSELVLVLLLGGMLFLASRSLRAVGLALFLFAAMEMPTTTKPIKAYTSLSATVKSTAKISNNLSGRCLSVPITPFRYSSKPSAAILLMSAHMSNSGTI